MPSAELSPQDRLELLESLRNIGAADGIHDFAVRVCRELLRLVPGLSSSYNETNVAAKRGTAVLHPDPGPQVYARYEEIFERHMWDHPTLRHFDATGEGAVVTWPDVDPDGKFFATQLYREFYEPRGIRDQIAFLLPAPPGINVAVAVSRGEGGFTARERALLTELRLHLVNLYRLVSYAEAKRLRDAALADDGWSVVLVDDDGVVLESNAVAEAIGRVAGVDLRVGAELGPLWSEIGGKPLDRWTLSRPGTPVRVSGGGPFEARLLRSPVGPHVLWIREPSRVTVEDAVALGLTRRQAEVAVLLVDGLTNAAIAQRLEITDSTVRRHMEAIFDRLGVRSRAAVVGRLRSAPRGRGE
jgi:DNA-binding CsgD family transcriptional regulator